MAAAANDIQETLVRRLSGVSLWVLIINTMIGAGIFGLPAEAARLSGAFSPWVFVICAALVLPIILCFAQLGSYFTGTGGPVLYAGTAFGPIIGFQVGWCLYVSRLLAFAANVNLLVGAVGYFLGREIGPGLRVTLLFAICALLTSVNIVGVRGAMRWLGVLTVLKILPLLALVLFGLPSVHGDLGFATRIGAHEVGAAVLLVIYAYTGFESGVVICGEARNPQRDLPRALVATLLLCTVLYASIQAVSVAALPTLASSTRALVDVAAALMGPWGALLLTAGLISSVGGNLLGSMFGAPRITYRLALDGNLPKWFGAVHPSYETPTSSIVFYGIACFLVAVSGGFAWLAGLTVLTRLLLYVVCIGAIPRLKSRFGAAPGALRLPGSYTVPVLAMAVCIGLLMQVNVLAYVSVAAFITFGTILFVAARAARARRGPRSGAALERLGTTP